MVSVISFCLKTHPGFRVEVTPSLNGDFINNNLSINRNTYAHLSAPTSASTFTTTDTLRTTAPSHVPKVERHGKLTNARYVNYDGKAGIPDVYDQPHEAFFYVELLCNIWFIVEFSTRFLVIDFHLSHMSQAFIVFFHFLSFYSLLLLTLLACNSNLYSIVLCCFRFHQI